MSPPVAAPAAAAGLMGRKEERKVHAVSPIVKGFAGASLGLSFQGAKNVVTPSWFFCSLKSIREGRQLCVMLLFYVDALI